MNFYPVILVAAALLSGCAHTGTFNVYGADKPFSYEKDQNPKDVVTKYQYIDKNDENYFRNKYDNAADDNIKRQVRNEIIYELMGVSDEFFHDYEKALRYRNVAKNLGFDALLLSITGATAVVGGEATKAILGAIATGVKGFDTSIDKNLFMDQTIQALELEMETLRSKRNKIIKDHLAKDDVTTYPLQAGLDDITEYYFSGSVTAALNSIVAKAGSDNQKAK